MNPGDSTSANRRWRAPPEHGGVLIDPPAERVGELLAQNLRLRQQSTIELLGRRLTDLAAQARRELLEAARGATSLYRDVPALPAEGPVLLSGHQPQLFHAGVWFKNFVLGGLAARHGGVGVNLVIDSDTLRSASIRVPGGSIENPTARAVEFDAPGPEIPFEERSILDPICFRTFGERCAAEVQPLIEQPLLREFWPLVLERSGETQNLGACLAQGRHLLEGEWGLSTLELPQSRVCELPCFAWFAAHLLTELPRLHEIYNHSLLEYRRMHGIRSKNHPAPGLDRDDDWLEAPFWLWRREDPRRRRLFVRRTGQALQLSDRSGLKFELPRADQGDASRAVAVLAGLPAQGVKLRTRALMTTLWARLALGDLFLHGIGGAKYDQLTDTILARFFGLEPPAFLTVTATLHLPIPHRAVHAADLGKLEQQLRDIAYHPERWLQHPEPPAVRWIQSKARWVATPQTRENARARCRGIREANEQLQRWTRPWVEPLVQEREETAAQLRAEAVLSSREYAFCLYPKATLRKFMLESLAPESYARAT